MNERTLLCIDLSYQTYRASAAHPMLTSGRIFTGGLYGFFVTVAKMIRDTRATDIVFCRDMKPYKRSETYPQYKQLRKKNADDELLKMFSQSMELILETLYASNLPVWGVKGFEFDDLAAHLVMKYRHRYEAIWAGTNDSDLQQLLWCEKFRIYRQSLADVWDHKTFRAMGMTVDQLILWHALQGTHNDIEGIHKVGPKTATNIVTTPAILRQFRDRYAELIERNISLIKLPHPAFPFEEELPKPSGAFDHRELVRRLSRYDIDFTASIDRSFRQVGGRHG